MATGLPCTRLFLPPRSDLRDWNWRSASWSMGICQVEFRSGRPLPDSRFRAGPPWHHVRLLGTGALRRATRSRCQGLAIRLPTRTPSQHDSSDRLILSLHSWDTLGPVWYAIVGAAVSAWLQDRTPAKRVRIHNPRDLRRSG